MAVLSSDLVKVNGRIMTGTRYAMLVKRGDIKVAEVPITEADEILLTTPTAAPPTPAQKRAATIAAKAANKAAKAVAAADTISASSDLDAEAAADLGETIDVDAEQAALAAVSAAMAPLSEPEEEG